MGPNRNAGQDRQLVDTERRKKDDLCSFRQGRLFYIQAGRRLFHLIIAIDNRSFHLFNQVSDRDTTWAGIGAIKNGPAAPDAIAITENLQAFGRALVTAIKDKTMGIDNGRRADPVGISPDGRT